jgi:hypothetical protein
MGTIRNRLLMDTQQFEAAEERIINHATSSRPQRAYLTPLMVVLRRYFFAGEVSLNISTDIFRKIS